MNLSEFYASKTGVYVMWMGNDGWIINLHGALISTDLDLHSSIRVPAPPNVDVNEMAGRIQTAFITHEHGDHFNTDTCLYLHKHSDCTFIVPKSCYRKALTIGLDDERIIIAAPGVSFALNGIQINPVRAIHGHYQGSVYGGASLGDCGYVISSGGFTLYQPGDTLLLAEHFEMDGIDLLFFSPTEHNTHIENSIRLIRLLRPGRIIPQHFDSYVTTPDNAFWTRGYPDEVYAMLTDTEKRAFLKLSQGRPARADWGS